VKVIVRSGFEEMKASPWEKEDAITRASRSSTSMCRRSFTHEDGKLTGMTFEKVRAVYDERPPRTLVPTGEPDVHFECDDVLVAVGQENAFPWIERDIGIEFDKWGMPVLDRRHLPVHRAEGVLRRRRRLRPKNIIWAVAHGHEAAVSIDLFLHGES
jgi:NADPH-dependent glutamate synthase beta subunit-like oxidoreductase